VALFAVLIELKCRHAADPLDGAGLAVAIHIDLRKDYLICVLLGQVLVVWRNLSARATSVGVVVDDDAESRHVAMVI